MKRLFGRVWVNILFTLLLMGFALNFVISRSVRPFFGFVVTAKITSFSLIALSSLILFFIILFTYLIVTKKIKKQLK